MKILDIKLKEDLTIELTNTMNIPSGNLNNILVSFDTTDIPIIDDLKLYAIFKKKGYIDSYQSELENVTIEETEYKNACYVPIDVLNEDGIISIGAYALEIENGEPTKRVSFNSISIEISKGSFENNLGDKQVPDLTKFEEFVVNVDALKEKTIIDFTNYYEEKKETLKGDKGDRGDKGDKGDAGAVKFTIVNELPTTNIDEAAIYLLPTEDEENAYNEYIYVVDKFEPLGQTQVEVDLTNYVTNTDLENALNNRIGTIETALQNINSGSGVE